MGFMGLNYPVVSNGVAATTIDTFIPTSTGNVSGTQNLTNGALNTPGGIYLSQPTPFAVAPNGEGSPRFLKYVRYNPTVSVAFLSGPAPVFWKDETFTVVTPTYTEAIGGGIAIANAANAFAGWLLPNTTALPGLSTASVLNGNWCFIHVGGFLAGAVSVSGVVAGDALIASSTAFTPARIAAGVAFTNKIAGFALTAISGGLSDIWVPFNN